MKVGDKVWYTQPRRDGLHEGTITKIGRLYFYVSRWQGDSMPFKVDRETMRDKTNSGWGYSCQVYLDKQVYLDEVEKNKLRSELQYAVDRGNIVYHMNLEELREMLAVVEKTRKRMVELGYGRYMEGLK